jgi:hypothetical protein
MTKKLLLLFLTLTTTFVFGQKKYEWIRALPFYFEDTDSIRKVTASGQSEFQLYYYNPSDKSIIVSSKSPMDFGADSCTIYKSKTVKVLNTMLSDSVSTFTYSLKCSYKNRAKAEKGLKYLCYRFDMEIPTTKDPRYKTVYFELANVYPICISHGLSIGGIEKEENGMYTFYMTFNCQGELDYRNYVYKTK